MRRDYMKFIEKGIGKVMNEIFGSEAHKASNKVNKKRENEENSRHVLAETYARFMSPSTGYTRVKKGVNTAPACLPAWRSLGHGDRPCTRYPLSGNEPMCENRSRCKGRRT